MRNTTLLVALSAAVVLGIGAWFFLSSTAAQPTQTEIEGRSAVESQQEANARTEASGAQAAPTEDKAGSSSDRSAVEAKPQAPATATQPQSEGPVLRGRVVSDAGAPLANARVIVGDNDFMPLEVISSSNEEFAKRWNTVTRADGRFEIRGPVAGRLRLGVWVDGYAPLLQENINLANGAGTDLGDVVVQRGVRLSGYVTVEGGGPVAGAKIFAEAVSSSGFSFSMPGRMRQPVAVTDAKGAFEINTQAAGPWKFLVSSANHPDRTFEGVAANAGAHDSGLNFALSAGATIAGQLAGLPEVMPDALQVLAREHRDGGWGPPVEARISELDADGRFVITGCKADTKYDVYAAVSDSSGLSFFGRPTTPRSETVTVPSGSLGVLLTFKPANGVTFLVVDQAGAPVEDMTVSVGRGYLRPHKVDDKVVEHFPGGLVMIDDLPFLPADVSPIPTEVAIEAVGFETQQIELAGQSQNGILNLGTITMRDVPVVRVRVVDADTGKPIEDARVTLALPSKEENPFGFVELADVGRMADQVTSRVARTKANGVATLSAFEGEVANVSVRHADFTIGRMDGVAMPVGEAVDVEVRMGRGGRVEVLAKNAIGEPIKGVRIHTRRPPEPQGGSNTMMRTLGASVSMGGPGQVDQSVTNDKGLAVFPHLEPGAHQFRIGNAPASGGGMFIAIESGNESQEPGWSQISVAEGETVELELIEEPMSELTGRVLEGGRPLAGARVRLQEAKDDNEPSFDFFLPNQGGTTTDGMGRFKMERVKPGDYTVVIEHSSRVMDYSEALTLGVGSETYSVDLPITIVEGRVTDAQGQPIQGAKVEAITPSEGRSSSMVSMFISDGGDTAITVGGATTDPARTNANGEYSLRGVASDRPIQVRATHASSAPVTSKELELGPGEVRRGIDLEMLPAGKLRVVLNGAPEDTFFLVHANYLDGAGIPPELTTLTDGEATLDSLRPGRWQLSLSEVGMNGNGAGDRDDWKREVVVKPGETTEAAFDN